MEVNELIVFKGFDVNKCQMLFLRILNVVDPQLSDPNVSQVMVKAFS